jgi:hypothetical protein
VNLKYEVKTGDFENDLTRIARGVQPPNLVEILRAGANVILDQTQQNILERELYDSGDLYDSARIVAINQYRVDVQVGDDKILYAAVHEYGGTFTITAKQEAAVWEMTLELTRYFTKVLKLGGTK